MDTGLLSFEAALLDLLLAGELPVLANLRAQLRASAVSKRDYSGVGVFTYFEVPNSAPLATPASFTITDVAYDLKGVENGGSVILFIRDGRLHMLEAYNWTDDWPANPEFTKLTYLRPGKRHVSETGAGHELLPTETRDLTALIDEIGTA